MPDANLPHISIELVTGTLDLQSDGDIDIKDYCDFAARANPKRGFLIVSKVLGRHLPASPRAMRSTMNDIAGKIPSDIPGPIVFLGMAETATALGQGVFAAYQAMNPDHKVVYLQSSRQLVDGAEVIATFEEGHSHASTHLIQVADRALKETVRDAASLVIVDDECSTGKTYVAASKAMLQAMPKMELVATCCITDWSGKDYIRDMPKPTVPVSILSGSMQWSAGAIDTLQPLAPASNVAGTAPSHGMNSRSGLNRPEKANRHSVTVKNGERILVLGDGEHSYEALLVAEEIEAKGGVAAVQCITRSPALVGAAMATKSVFTDSYGSGAPCFLYNIAAHEPDRVLIVVENAAEQALEAAASLRELNVSANVELLCCSYAGEGTEMASYEKQSHAHTLNDKAERVGTAVQIASNLNASSDHLNGTPIILTDLDDTLFQTRRKIAADATELKMMSTLVDGSPSGFATIQQQNLLRWFQIGLVIPVTARSSDVFARVALPASPAICSNGGCILNLDGTYDQVWHQKLTDASVNDVSVSVLFHEITGQLCQIDFRCWIVSENGLDNYFVIKSNHSDENALANLEGEFSSLIPPGWRCHRNGNNLAYLPPWLSKRHAARYLIQKYRASLPNSPIIGAGDSISDIGFMDLCDFAMAPTKTQLWSQIVTGNTWVSE